MATPLEKKFTPIEPVHTQEKSIRATMGRIRHKLFIMSGKGGVGKSSVTANLACALALKGFSVGILDVDIHGPSIPRLLGIGGGIQADEAGRILPERAANGLKVLSMDSLLKDRDTAIIWRGPKKTSAIRQFVSDVEWGDLDFLLIDSPPGTGDEHMTVLQSVPDAQCIVVTTPQELSLADVRKALHFLELARAKVLGLVENMSGLNCPHCGGAIPLFKSGGGRALAESRGLAFLGAVPIDPAAVVAADQGQPVVSLEGDFPAKSAFLAVADAVIAETARAVEKKSGATEA